ncbi:MAG: PaaI family thioesterase [Chloroflexi bacterium]|nr:PaaI family thioesterase [Chloroflexota bacterium]
MPNEAHFRKLENMYRHAESSIYHESTMTITGEGRAEVVIPVREDFYHGAKAVHGSVYFKALDEAAFFAVNSLVEETFVLTANFNIYLLRPITEGVMRAVGQVVHHTRTQFIAESVLYDGDGNMLARGSGTFVRGKTPLSPAINYELPGDSGGSGGEPSGAGGAGGT